jgi:hypothetical protein
MFNIYNKKDRKLKKLKTIKIDETLHGQLKEYSKKNSLKLNDWLEKLIQKEFEKIIGN